MSDKLSECPFCGSSDIEYRAMALHWVRCRSCGSEGPGRGNKDAAIAAWNRRASPAPAIPAEPDDEAISAVRARLEQHAVYFSRSSIEEIVSAVRKTAPAISESEPTVAMIDAARPFFLGRECGCATIEGMRKHFDLSGIDISALPAWFREGAGHLTKAGQAIIVWHLMDAARKGEKS